MIMENPNQECTLCRYTLEKYATLFYVEYPDTGIEFHAIRNIQFCPLCGKELKFDWREKRRLKMADNPIYDNLQASKEIINAINDTNTLSAMQSTFVY